MNIAVDGGALCSPKTNRYGTYSFSKNILEAVGMYDVKNIYDIYTFCKAKDVPSKQIHILSPKIAWNTLRLSIEEMIHRHDIYLALNQSIPLYCAPKIISFSHGLSFMKFPRLYPDSYGQMRKQLSRMIEKSTYCIVSSERVKEEMLMLFPHTKNIVVLPFGIPFDILDKENVRTQPEKQYFLFVGMNHPIKNIPLLVESFLKLKKQKQFSHFELHLVGPFVEYIDKKNSIYCFPVCSRQELIKKYAEATVYLAPSLYESFNLPVLEALACGTQVAGLQSAIIPELAPYVHVAETDNDFVNTIVNAVQNPKTISQKELKKQFSWKEYVKKLIGLYE